MRLRVQGAAERSSANRKSQVWGCRNQGRSGVSCAWGWAQLHLCRQSVLKEFQQLTGEAACAGRMWGGVQWDVRVWICFDVPVSAKVSLHGCRLSVGSDTVTPESISRPSQKTFVRGPESLPQHQQARNCQHLEKMNAQQGEAGVLAAPGVGIRGESGMKPGSLASRKYKSLPWSHNGLMVGFWRKTVTPVFH